MSGQKRILFFMQDAGYLRFFDQVIEGLLQRGHSVDLRVERSFVEGDETAWLDRMRNMRGFSYAVTETLRSGRWWRFGKEIRKATDYLHFTGERFSGRPALLARGERRASAGFLRFMRSAPFASPRVQPAILRLLMLIERAIPTNKETERELFEPRPDVFVIVPNLSSGSRNDEYVKLARHARVPTCMCIASWDNLSTKQRVREAPERLVVWNEIQRTEAKELHEIDPRTVSIVGAYPFDRWFAWTPRPREEFCAHVGLDPRREYLLYVGGALFPAVRTEAEWVRDEWIPGLRADSRLAGLGVLVRGHPERRKHWEAVDFSGFEDVEMWPRGLRQAPINEVSRADYYDSIYHSAAVIGVNTSAMIEAAIVGRPVHTILVPDFEPTQRGTFHFDYLLEVGGGLLVVGHTPEEHRDQLAASLRGDDPQAPSRTAFLESFVRPHGLDRPALPTLLDTIEEVAELPPAAVRVDGPVVLATRAFLRAVLISWHATRRFRVGAE